MASSVSSDNFDGRRCSDEDSRSATKINDENETQTNRLQNYIEVFHSSIRFSSAKPMYIRDLVCRVNPNYNYL